MGISQMCWEHYGVKQLLMLDLFFFLFTLLNINVVKNDGQLTDNNVLNRCCCENAWLEIIIVVYKYLRTASVVSYLIFKHVEREREKEEISSINYAWNKFLLPFHFFSQQTFPSSCCFLTHIVFIFMCEVIKKKGSFARDENLINFYIEILCLKKFFPGRSSGKKGNSIHIMWHDFFISMSEKDLYRLHQTRRKGIQKERKKKMGEWRDGKIEWHWHIWIMWE